MTTATINDTYAQLEQLCGNIVKHYRDDLLIHDKRWLNDWPGEPFLHFSRECGTHLLPLISPDKMPRPGERVPYLFGTCDGPGIASQAPTYVKTIGECFTTQLILHFDGRKFRKISMEQARDIASEYPRKCERFWRQ